MIESLESRIKAKAIAERNDELKAAMRKFLVVVDDCPRYAEQIYFTSEALRVEDMEKGKFSIRSDKLRFILEELVLSSVKDAVIGDRAVRDFLKEFDSMKDFMQDLEQ